MEKIRIQSIPKKEILQDFFFCFSANKDLSALERSVRASGILNPLWVLPVRKGFQILSGFGRFRAAVAAGMEALPCRMLEKSVSVDRHFENALLEQTSLRGLHLMEKARILRILAHLEIPQKQILVRFAPILDFPATPGPMEEALGLLELHPKLQSYLERHLISLKQISVFRKFDCEGQALMADLGTTLQIRIVELSELAEQVYEISRREELTVEAVVEDVGIAGAIQNADLNRNEKVIKVKELLRWKRYPRLVSWNEKIRSILDEIGLPPFVHLDWDPSLESPGLRMEVQIRTPEDVEALVRFLSIQGNRDRLKAVLEIV